MTTVRIGISTCPNDTFAFHPLLTRALGLDGVELEFTLADVQELNDAAAAERFDLVKISYAAALELADRYAMLPGGSALGFGVGPLVLGRAGVASLADLPASTPVLCPGARTTATLLWRLFHPDFATLDQRVFHEIMPALESGDAHVGVCIHEGRFTWEEHGLSRLEDLGQRWERETDAPLPLGGIAARRALDPALARDLAGLVQRSILQARSRPQDTLATMREHAQEHSDDVLWKHVELYVNDWTVDLGREGRRAIAKLSELARERGLLPEGAALEVIDVPI